MENPTIPALKLKDYDVALLEAWLEDQLAGLWKEHRQFEESLLGAYSGCSGNPKVFSSLMENRVGSNVHSSFIVTIHGDW